MSTITQFPSGNTQYRIEFDYLARTFVVVTLVNSSNPTLNRVLEVGRDYRFLNPTMIEMLVDQSGFDIVRIHRQTGTDLVVDFRNGSVLTASDLTTSELQAIHIAEEGRDQTVDLAKEYADAAGNSAGNAKDSEDEARRIATSIKEAGLIGYITRRSFEEGFTVSTWNEVLLWEEDGDYYRWDGTLPKDVPAGSTPESSGGISLGAWVSVGDAALRTSLKSPGGDKLVGSSHGGGTIFDDYPAKTEVFPLTNIYPTMTNAEINAILAAGGCVYFNAGEYVVSSADDTFKLNQHLRILSHPRALLKAGANGVTVMRASSQDIGTTVRNFKAYELRIDLNGFNNCIGFHGYDVRNNSLISDMWIDMKLGTSCTGLLIEHYSYGMRLDNVEILNGGTGSVRRMLRNGVNSVTLKDHIGYSADHLGPLPDYDTVIFNGLNGAFNFPSGSDLWPTAAVNIVGGFMQNTAKYGLLDSGVSTNVIGTYFERNAVSDVALAAGSYYFTSKATHHSLNIGESCFRISGASHYDIGEFNPAARSIGQFNAISGTNGKGNGSKFWGTTLDSNIGVVDGIRLDLGPGSVKQYTAGTLPIKIREGFRSYRMNVTSGLNITVTGAPFDGQVINMLVRGSNLASLSFAGVPVDVTGANTAQTKTAQFTATYWASIGKWTLSMPSWTASS